MKIKGAELQEFLNSGWPGPNVDDWYWDHDEFDYHPEPNTTYDTEDLGDIMWQGDGDAPNGRTEIKLDSQIRKWRKERDNVILNVAVPKDKEDDFKAYLKSIKGKVLK